MQFEPLNMDIYIYIYICIYIYTYVLSTDVLSMCFFWCSKYRISKSHLEHLYPCKLKNIFCPNDVLSVCPAIYIYIYINPRKRHALPMKSPRVTSQLRPSGRRSIWSRDDSGDTSIREWGHLGIKIVKDHQI